MSAVFVALINLLVALVFLGVLAPWAQTDSIEDPYRGTRARNWTYDVPRLHTNRALRPRYTIDALIGVLILVNSSAIANGQITTVQSGIMGVHWGLASIYAGTTTVSINTAINVTWDLATLRRMPKAYY